MNAKQGMLAAPIAIFGFLFGVVFMMQLISWNSITGAVVYQSCYDSDDTTASIPGTVTVADETGGETTRADLCTSPTLLREQTCEGKQPRTVEIPCNECVVNDEGIGYCTS